jgi:hypothetical protein
MVAELTRSYVNFATDNGHRHDLGTFVLIAGPVLIAVLAGYFVHNMVAATVHGVRTLREFARQQLRPVPIAPVVALPAGVAEPDTATIYIATSVA